MSGSQLQEVKNAIMDVKENKEDDNIQSTKEDSFPHKHLQQKFNYQIFKFIEFLKSLLTKILHARALAGMLSCNKPISKTHKCKLNDYRAVPLVKCATK